MSGRVIFLLEEPSMKAMLAEYLPRLVPGWIQGQHFLLLPHQGKSDLDKSIPIKLKAWQEPGARFVVVRDNDNADCPALKARLQTMCATSGRKTLIRLVCQELESWYLADPDALIAAYPEAQKKIRTLAKRFPDPDECQKPSHELERNIKDFQKNEGARRLGRLLDADRATSRSLKVFAQGVRMLAERA